MKRFKVNKRKSARKFNKQSSVTRAANIAPPPMRGGYRL